jgi:hypothetical protein
MPEMKLKDRKIDWEMDSDYEVLHKINYSDPSPGT